MHALFTPFPKLGQNMRKGLKDHIWLPKLLEILDLEDIMTKGLRQEKLQTLSPSSIKS